MPPKKAASPVRAKTPTNQATATVVLPPPGYAYGPGVMATAVPVDNKVLYTHKEKSPQKGGQDGVGTQQQSGDTRFQDLWAAVLFLLHLLVILWLALGPGMKALRKSGADDSVGESSPSTASDKKSAGLVYGGIAVLLAVGAIWSQVIVNVLLRCKAWIIEASLAFSVGTCLAGAVVAAVYGIWPMVFISVIAGLLQLMWWWCARSRIPFASANLEVAVTAVQAQSSTSLTLALAMTIVNAGWVLLWALAASGVAMQQPSQQMVVIDGSMFFPAQCTTVENTCVCDGTDPAVGTCASLLQMEAQVSGFILFFLLLSLQWGSLVIKEVLFCAISGAVADWWFNGASSTGVVWKSLVRASTTSLGSVCIGALILAVLRTLRQIIRNADRGEENAASCIAQCIENMMTYFNRYTMVYVSLYGGSFMESGKKVFELFNNRGFTAIINDDLVENALTLVSLVVGVVTAVVGVVYATAVGLDDAYVIALGFVGFFVGLVVGSIVLGVVDAAVATVFVCFAEDPTGLSKYPALFEKLRTAWMRMGYDIESQRVVGQQR